MPKTAIQKVTYSSSDAKIATVTKDGKVSGKKEGKATIIVTSQSDKSKKAKCVVNIVAPGDGDYTKLSGPRTDAFLVADQNLDVFRYNEKWTDVTWETSTIRSWLNGYDSEANASYGFLPYKDENNVVIYDKARERTDTAYVAAGSNSGLNGYVDSWWLRSPSSHSYEAAVVYGNGNVGGIIVSASKYTVCPALHLNLSATNVWSNAETVTVYR